MASSLTFRLKNIFLEDLFILKRKREERGGTEGEGERESQADAPMSVQPNVGLDP